MHPIYVWGAQPIQVPWLCWLGVGGVLIARSTKNITVACRKTMQRTGFPRLACAGWAKSCGNVTLPATLRKYIGPALDCRRYVRLQLLSEDDRIPALDGRRFMQKMVVGSFFALYRESSRRINENGIFAIPALGRGGTALVPRCEPWKIAKNQDFKCCSRAG